MLRRTSKPKPGSATRPGNFESPGDRQAQTGQLDEFRYIDHATIKAVVIGEVVSATLAAKNKMDQCQFERKAHITAQPPA